MSTTADSLELGGSGEHSIRQGTDQLLVAFEKSDGTYHLGTHHLPGNAEAKIEGLKSWHNNVLERRKRMRAFLMCKTAYIAVGTLGVSLTLL